MESGRLCRDRPVRTAITIVIENGFDVDSLGRFNVLLSIVLITGQLGQRAATRPCSS